MLFAIRHFFANGVFDRADAKYYKNSIGHHFLLSTMVYGVLIYLLVIAIIKYVPHGNIGP